MHTQSAPLTLGTERISILLRQYAIPAIIAQTATSLYNMIDSIFIGHGVGPLALSGLAVTFPLMNLSTAFGTLVGVGSATMISMRLGQKDYKNAQNILGNSVVLNVIIGMLFALLAYIFLDPILYFFGASEDTLPYARDYMEILLIGNVITHLYFGLNNVLRASGHPKKAMTATIMTVVINTILDPIFIFGFGWGIKGAAIATVLGQLLALLWLLRFFAKKENLLHFEKGIYKLKKHIVTPALSIGISPFLMNVASSLIVILINQALGRHGGDLAIGAFGIINRIEYLFLMIVLGFNQGMQPIAGYNYGAEQYSRVTEVLKLTIRWATIVTCIGFVIGMGLPDLAVSLFTPDADLKEIAVLGLRISIIMFPIVGFQMVSSNFFQSIGMVKKS
ncbi:MAG: MATE family efflux transporter, partial [Bacteroidales bacterium]|nr:MATE family efflux transporter [Bacteroidales bacterium]